MADFDLYDPEYLVTSLENPFNHHEIYLGPFIFLKHM